MIRAVLLDALGTLLELKDPAPLLVEQLEARGVAVSGEQARTAVRAEIRYYRAHHDEAATLERLADLRRRCAEVLAGALPPAARRLSPAELEDALLTAIRFEPFAEVRRVLRELRADGMRLVVVSNWDVSLHEQLSATGLRALVDEAISSAEVGAAKPDPAVFAEALRLADVDADEALMVGDDPAADVDGARKAGIAAVLVDRSAGGPVAGAIASLAELRGLVRSLP